MPVKACDVGRRVAAKQAPQPSKCGQALRSFNGRAAAAIQPGASHGMQGRSIERGCCGTLAAADDPHARFSSGAHRLAVEKSGGSLQLIERARNTDLILLEHVLPVQERQVLTHDRRPEDRAPDLHGRAGTWEEVHPLVLRRRQGRVLQEFVHRMDEPGDHEAEAIQAGDCHEDIRLTWLSERGFEDIPELRLRIHLGNELDTRQSLELRQLRHDDLLPDVLTQKDAQLRSLELPPVHRWMS